MNRKSLPAPADRVGHGSPPGGVQPPASISDARRSAQIGARLGVAAGAAWLALGLESTVRGGEMHYRDALWIGPWILTIATLAALHVAQRRHLSRAGRVSGYALGATMLLVAMGNIGLVIDNETLTALGFPAGVMLWIVAMIPYGIATARAQVVPRVAGVALALLEPLSIVTGLALSPIAGLYERGNYSGGIEKGVVLLIVAGALARRAAALTTRPVPGIAQRFRPQPQDA